MRIMHMTSGGPTVNGALLYAVDLAKRQAAAGHDVWMLTPAGSYVAQACEGSPVQHVASDLSRWPLDELKRVHGFLDENAIDLVHGHTSRAFNFGVSLRRLFGVSCVSTAHSNKVQVHWCLADHVIAVSKATQRFHCRWNFVRRSRASVILNPIDTTRFQPLAPEDRSSVRSELGVNGDQPLLLIAGHVVKRKGQLVAVQAMPRILSAFPDARLLFVGHESHAYGLKVREEIKRLGLSEQVTLLPSRSEIEQVFAAADLCLCPSLDEPFGLTAVEAMACEVPVIASRLGGFLETVQPGRTGVLVPRGNAVALADAAIALLSDRPRGQQLGRDGRRWVRETLGADAHDAAVQQVYECVLAKRRRRTK